MRANRCRQRSNKFTFLWGKKKEGWNASEGGKSAEGMKIFNYEIVLRESDCVLVLAVANVFLDPIQVVGDVGVHRWEAFDSALFLSETHHSGQHPLKLFRVVIH